MNIITDTKNPAKIKKGQWYTLCCHYSLMQAHKDIELYDCGCVEYWDTAIEALYDLRKSFESSGLTQQVNEIDIMLIEYMKGEIGK